MGDVIGDLIVMAFGNYENYQKEYRRVNTVYCKSCRKHRDPLELNTWCRRCGKQMERRPKNREELLESGVRPSGGV